RLKFIFNKIRAAGIAKNFKIKLKGEDGRNIDSFFESLFNDYFKHSIPDFAHKFDIYTNLLNKIKPTAALLDESVSSLRKPFELAAKIRNVPVFVINHGIPAKGYPIFLNKNITDYSYLLIGGEYIKEVYGGYYKANMGKLIVTGTPRYDDIYSLKKSEDSAANTICFAPTFFLKRGTTYNFTDYIVNFKQNLHVIVEKYKEKPFRLIVKFHPGDPHENIVRSAFAASEVKATYVADRLRSIDVLKDSELLITCWSSMALEGCLCNLPVIIMNNFAGIPEPIDFVKDRIAIFARTPEALGRLIDDYRAGILNNPSYASNAKSASFKYEKFQDGKASKRVAEFILKEIGYK
ncbi:MAG: CDP-glycerol glycerophosphotransferase family protein, partial [Proteobacteria bacterium]|nr:CDP-glycerol glycerophosphotransferase family protein [Pseudomonadota bacterium]